MAPNISGIGMVDQARAAHLAELALEFAVKSLKPGGNLLVKGFQGAGYNELRASLRRHFRQVLTRKPEASRSRSSEIYLLAKDLIARPTADPAQPDRPGPTAYNAAIEGSDRPTQGTFGQPRHWATRGKEQL